MHRSPWPLLAALLLAAFAASALRAQAQAAGVLDTLLTSAGGGLARFPVADRQLTVGEFFEVLARPDVAGLNLVLRDSVARDATIPTTLKDLSCRDALELVLALEGLEIVPFKPPRIFIVQRVGDKALVGDVHRRTFRLTHTTTDRVLAALHAAPATAPHVDLARVIADPGSGTLTIVDAPPAIAEFQAALAQLDVPSPIRTVRMDLGSATKESLEAAMRVAGLDAQGGGSPVKVAVLPDGHSALVAGTPEQIEQVRHLVATLDVEPEQVQIGVSVATVAADSTSTRGIGIDPIAIGLPARGSTRIGGRVAYQDSLTSSSGSKTIWITALSGYPSRIGLDQIFNVPSATVVGVPGGGVGIVTGVREIPVGLSLEVVPKVAGRLVLLDLRLVDTSPTQITDIGVNRSGITLATGLAVPRGASASVGGFGQAIASSGHSGLLANASRHIEDTGLTVFVR